jgi:hypothetical protein
LGAQCYLPAKKLGRQLKIIVAVIDDDKNKPEDFPLAE